MRRVGEITVRLYAEDLPSAPPGKLTKEQAEASNAERAKLDAAQMQVTHHALQHIEAAIQQEVGSGAKITVVDIWRGRQRRK